MTRRQPGRGRLLEASLMWFGALVALFWAYRNLGAAGSDPGDTAAVMTYHSAGIWSLLIALLLAAGGAFIFVNRKR